MNNYEGYSIYKDVIAKYDSSSFSSIESTAEGERILSATDSSMMFNHLVTPNVLSGVANKIGLYTVFNSLVDKNQLIDNWKATIDTTPPEYRLSSMSDSAPYAGLQWYVSGIERVMGECAERIANACFSLDDSGAGLNGTMIVPS